MKINKLSGITSIANDDKSVFIGDVQGDLSFLDKNYEIQQQINIPTGVANIICKSNSIINRSSSLGI